MLKALQDGLLNRATVAIVGAVAGAVGVLVAKAYPALHNAFCNGVI